MTLSSLDALFRLSKLLYESGSYGPAAAGLKLWRKLCPGVTAVSNSDAALGALWGKFAGDIMGGDWEGANQVHSPFVKAHFVAVWGCHDLRKFRVSIILFLSSLQARLDLTTAIDRSSSPKHVTQSQRAWAAHWSLFIFFR